MRVCEGRFFAAEDAEDAEGGRELGRRLREIFFSNQQITRRPLHVFEERSLI
jgi:hypothetical protein